MADYQALRRVSAKSRAQLLTMQRSQERLLGLVNQILDLAKLEAGGVQLQAARTPHLNVLVARRVAPFRAAAAERRIDVVLELGDRLDGADLYLNRQKFDQLLVNLLANA